MVDGIDRVDVGAMIRAARTRAGLTQMEFAAALDSSESGLRRWESGRARPSLKKRRLLAARFGVRI